MYIQWNLEIMNGTRPRTGKINYVPYKRFWYCIYFFLIIYFTISGVKKPCLLYQGFHCVEVHYTEVSLYFFHKEISTSCLELKLSCLTFLERFYPLKNNVNPSLLDFLFNDPPSLCVATFHHPHPKKKKRTGGSPLATCPFLEAWGEEFSQLEGAATWL